MKNFRSFLKYLSLTLLTVSIAVVVGVFCIFSERNNDVKISEEPVSIVNTTYKRDDFFSDAIIESEDNYLKELGLSSGSSSGDFKLFFEKVEPASDADFTYSIDVNGNGLYEEDVQDVENNIFEINNTSGSSLSIKKDFNAYGNTDISFRIIPNQGVDFYGNSANAYFVSAIYLYTSDTEMFNGVQSSISDASSQRGKLIYPTTSIIAGDIKFSFTCDNETGALECDLTTLEKKEILTNLKFSFEISYRDNSVYANKLEVAGETDVVVTNVENGDYSINNSDQTFSVDDKLVIDIKADTKIAKTLTLYGLTENGEYVEWFKVYGGVAGGSGVYAFTGGATPENVVPFSNFAVGFKYSENYLSGSFGKFTQIDSIYDADHSLNGKKITVPEDERVDHRHKFAICLYDDGSITIEKVGNECSLKLDVSTQHYFVVNLQKFADGTSASNNEPYKSIVVSSGSTPIVSASGEDLQRTTYIGVGDGNYSLTLEAQLNTNYEWYRESMNVSCIVDDITYKETFSGGIKTLTAISSSDKIFQLTISVEVAQDVVSASQLLKKSNLEILIGEGENPEDESSCFGVANTGIGSKAVELLEAETEAKLSYSIKLPYGLEIFKYSINGEVTELDSNSTLLEIQHQLITIEGDCNITYYVKPIYINDINVYNQEEDTESPVGKLQFYPMLDTSTDFKIEYSLYYMDLSATGSSYQILYGDNCPTKTGYKLIGLFESASVNGDEDNFIDENYQFVGLQDYTGYPEEVVNITSYITYLYSLYRSDFASFKIYCSFEAITYINQVKTTPEPTVGNPSPSTEILKCEATYDDEFFYTEDILHSKTGYYVAGVSYTKDGQLIEILFNSSIPFYDDTLPGDCKYRYKLEEPWNVAKSGITFNTLLKPIRYQGTAVIAEISKYYFKTDDPLTANDESVIKSDQQQKNIYFDDAFSVSGILAAYTREVKNKLDGYELIGYMPVAQKIEDITILDGAKEELNPDDIFYYIYDENTFDVAVAEKMLLLGESYTWKYQRNIRFVPVYMHKTYTLTLHAGQGNKFDVGGSTTISISAKFNDELTEDFIKNNFLSTFNLIAGYDFGGYYYLDDSLNPVMVVGGQKIIDDTFPVIRYEATNIVKDAVDQIIQNFAYMYNGEIYWGLTRDLNLEIKFNKINYKVTMAGKDAEGQDIADMSSQNMTIYEKQSNGEIGSVGFDTTYAEFINSKTVNINNVLALKNLGDVGTFVKKITLKYNTLFNETDYITAYVFNYKTDINGKMTFVSEGSDSAEKIYYNSDEDAFYIDIKEVLERERQVSSTVGRIKDIKIEFEYDYRSYVIGFQTGAYGTDLNQIVTPSEAGTAYYLVNYKTRNDYSTWQPCTSDGTLIEDYTNVWQSISFKHNTDIIKFEEDSLNRTQEIDIIIGTDSYFFCYWARRDAGNNVEPLSWIWADAGNVANSEDGGSLMYYSVFSKNADINVYYYTWDPVAKEEAGTGYVETSRKGYFWFKEHTDGSFKTVNSYEKYKIGNHTYYISGWIKLEDNIDQSTPYKHAMYDLKNNIFVDSYTYSITGGQEILDTTEFYYGLLEEITGITYRGNTNTDANKIKIHYYAVYSLYEFEVEPNTDKTEFTVKMNVPNDYAGNSYTTGDLHWGAISSTKYSELLGKYLTIKDMVNSGEIILHSFGDSWNGKTLITKDEAIQLLSVDKELLICYYSREVIGENPQTILVDALGIGVLTVNDFEYDGFEKIGSYADGTLVGVLDEFIKLNGSYITAYANAVNQMKLLGISGDEFNKRELILRITLQLLQWDAGFSNSNSQGIKYKNDSTTVGFEGFDVNIEECIEQISDAQGGKISVSAEGFVRLVYALAGYSINSTNPDNAYGLFGGATLGTQNSFSDGDVKCGDLILYENNPDNISIWLYSFQDASGNEYGVIANCRAILSDTELCGSNRTCKFNETKNEIIYTDKLFTYTYNRKIDYCTD